MNSTVKDFAKVAVVFVVLAVSAGCRSDVGERAQDTAAGWPERLASLSVVWTGEREVDLLTGPAVPVRAYIESFLLGELTGETTFLYPGFIDAAAEQWRPSGPAAPQPWVGTMTNHILSLVNSGTGVTALGCMYTYNAASPYHDEYEAQGIPFGAPEAGISAFKVTLEAPDSPQGPSNEQQGPSRASFDDVFGGYKITGYDGGYFEAAGADHFWPERAATTAECIAKAPDPFDRRKYLTSNYLPRTEFPMLPAVPGWPARRAS